MRSDIYNTLWTSQIASGTLDRTSRMSTSTALWDKIRRAYGKAEVNKAIYRIHTQPRDICDAATGLTFVLQVSEALRDKPKAAKERSSQPADAFETPDPDLTIEECLTPTHMLRLNKFNVVPYHILVITRHFEEQTKLLTVADWEATLSALQAYPEGALAFFNGGLNAGSSQPRKHVQLVPLVLNGHKMAPLPFHPAAREACLQSGRPVLRAVRVTKAPFQCFAAMLPAKASAEDLQQAYQSLLDVRPPSSRDADYNLLLTADLMLLVPRYRDLCGPVSCNSLGFAGTLLLRSVEELEFVKQQGPMKILTAVTFPWDLQN